MTISDTIQTAKDRAGAAVRAIFGQYEGASKGRRTQNWRAPSTGPNSAMDWSLPTLRDRSRDLVRNNPTAKRGMGALVNNVIGTGILPTAKNGDGTDSEIVEAVLKAWCDKCACDAMGRSTFYGLQALVMGAVAESGAALVIRERKSKAEMRALGLTIPLQLRVIESDYLDTFQDGPIRGGGFITRGIEFSPAGRPVAYYLFDEHPGETKRYTSLQSRRVPAEDVAHVFRIERPGQTDGVPWLSSVMIRLKDFDEYEHAQLVRQKIAAAFSVFIRTSKGEPPEGAGDEFTLKPGMVRWLEPGEDVTFASPPGVEGHEGYARVNKRDIAAGLGITYEALTADYSQVNYSSARMAHLEMLANVHQIRHNMLIPQLCHRVENWIKEACELVGIPAQDTVWEWTPPRREMLDPSKEVNAMNQAIRSGLTTRQEEIRKLGRDSRDVMREIAADNALADELGLILDSDPRAVSQQGMQQTKPTNGDAADTDDT
jgi:lambda family phage portal protein